MSREQPVIRLWAVGALAVAALLAGGCSRAIGGTPVAAPGAAGAVLNSTCGQFVTFGTAERREVIIAIGEDGNKLVALNPDAWVDLAAALCTFVNPDALVKEVLRGALR